MHVWVHEWGKYAKRTWKMHVLGSRLRCMSGCIASKKCPQVSHLGWDPLWCSSGEGGGAPLFYFYCCRVPAFSCGWYHPFFPLSARWENNLYFLHLLRSEDCHLHFLMLSFKIPVYSRKVIPFDIIIALEIFCPPSLATPPPFLTVWFVGLGVQRSCMVLIILNAFSLRLISSITPMLENRCCSMISAYTCRNLWVDPPVGIRRLVPQPWRYDFSRLCPRQYIFETTIGFVGTFQLRTLVLGRSPCSVDSLLGCAAAQTQILSVTCNSRPSLSARGVCVGFFRGLTLWTLH